MVNWNRVAGEWRQLKGRVQQMWSRQTYGDLDPVDGKSEEILDRIQKRFGKSRAQADREVRDWFERREARRTELTWRIR